MSLINSVNTLKSLFNELFDLILYIYIVNSLTYYVLPLFNTAFFTPSE